MTYGADTPPWLIAQVGRLALIALASLAIACRPLRAMRRFLGFKPRLVWGPVPLVNIKYWSAALRTRGYRSMTIVDFVSRISVRGDFDRLTGEFLWRGRLSALTRPFAVFARVLVSFDVVFSSMDGGFLRGTPLRDWEGWLLRLGGMKLVSWPYGSDIAVPGHLGTAEVPLLKDYPEFVKLAEQTRQRVDWFCRWSDVVIRNWQFGYLPRWDVVWPTMLALDTDEWVADRPTSEADGVDGEVVIVHAPNHRHVKGTDPLIGAIADLKGQGLKVDLNLIEGRTNAEVKRAVLATDIVADQFFAGYAMFALEGLCAGKPVLSALSGMPEEVRETEIIRSCPIVDTGVENLSENLTRLVRDPELRRRLGEESRRFALDYHSLPAAARSFELILDHLWRGAPLPSELPRR